MKTFAAIVLLPAALAASMACAAAVPPLSFKSVELGTPLAAWRSLKPPGLVSDHVKRVCTAGGAGPNADLRPLDVPPDALVCAYVDVYGTLHLPVTFSWGHGYGMDHLRYVFRGDKLTEIRAQIDNDAFEALMGDLKSSWGPPAKLIRDTARTEIGPEPRVRAYWSTPKGRISIVDPSAPGKLALRISSAAALASKTVR